VQVLVGLSTKEEKVCLEQTGQLLEHQLPECYQASSDELVDVAAWKIHCNPLLLLIAIWLCRVDIIQLDGLNLDDHFPQVRQVFMQKYEHIINTRYDLGASVQQLIDLLLVLGPQKVEIFLIYLFGSWLAL